MLPFPLIKHFILGITVNANPVSLSFKKLSLVFLLIFIDHLPITHLIFLELALKRPSFVELVMPDHLLIIPPRSVELIPV